MSKSNIEQVELIGVYGGDETHSLSAWTSTIRELNYDKRNRMGKMLKDLANNGHHTPFEKSSLHFLVTTTISTHIQIIKHRIGTSVNAESARYKELKEDKYYIPDDWINIYVSNDSEKDIKQKYGIDIKNTWAETLEWYTELGNSLYHKSCDDLTPILGRKRTKESARFFKNYNSQITADIMFNFRSFMWFQKLRNDDHAQKEIHEIAQRMLELVQETGNFDLSLEAFGYGKRSSVG